MADPATITKLSVPLLCASTPSSSSSARSHPRPAVRSQQETVCVEGISAGSYLSMAAHPEGSDRVFLATQDGKIWLASVPAHGSGGRLHVGARPFLDLKDRYTILGLRGAAFHPLFTANGRFFVSYICDSSASPAYGAGAGNGSLPCQHQLVVAEFLANGVDYSKATHANPYQVRRIFNVCLPKPYTSYSYQHHGGQILFQPRDSDGYLYLMTGHGDFSKERRSFLGKVIRFNVGGMPGESRRTSSHGAPTMGKPEIFAVGLKNPSGCSFDSERPSYLYCADVDEHQFERVYLISKGNGSSSSSKTAVSLVVVNHGRPADGRMPSIVGGLVYRGSANVFLNGRYLHMYAAGAWFTGVEPPEGRNGRYASSRIPNVSCSGMRCHARGTGIGGRVLSFGEDNSATTRSSSPPAASTESFCQATVAAFLLLLSLLGQAGCSTLA